MLSIELPWKENNINLNLLNTKVKQINAAYLGCAADIKLTLYFDALTEEETQAIKDYWESLTEESEEVITYKSREDEELELKAKKESAKQKLIAIGLSEDEISALIGV